MVRRGQRIAFLSSVGNYSEEERFFRVLGDPYMAWLIRTLRLPAGESHTNLALAICVFLMSLMSIGLLWQAQIIADQRDAIHWLESMKFGS